MNNGSVLRVNIHNPPISLYDSKLNTDMVNLLRSLKPGNVMNLTVAVPNVIVFSSGLSDFWMGHYDLNLLIPNATFFTTDYTNELFSTAVEATQLLRSLPTVFIAEINGHAIGSGNEFLLQCDMSFAGPNAIVGNGGIKYLVRKVGMQRAAEYLLAATSVGAREAAAVGWVNRAYDSASDLRNAGDDLADQLSLSTAGVLNGTKTAIRAFGPSAEQSAADIATILRLVSEEIKYLPRYVELSNNQTDNEFEMGALRDIEDVKALVQ